MQSTSNDGNRIPRKAWREVSRSSPLDHLCRKVGPRGSYEGANVGANVGGEMWIKTAQIAW